MFMKDSAKSSYLRQWNNYIGKCSFMMIMKVTDAIYVKQLTMLAEHGLHCHKS